jgi:hypothetical protein
MQGAWNAAFDVIKCHRQLLARAGEDHSRAWSIIVSPLPSADAGLEPLFKHISDQLKQLITR